MKFVKRKNFYKIPVYEFNLPAGHSCPFAKDCKVLVDRKTGKMEMIGKKFRCYASAAERFPAVREMRWKNFEDVLNGDSIEVPKDATHVRIHGSGDFYNQDYFDRWLDVCRKRVSVRFWAFTKSVKYWINRLSDVPKNLVLQASIGSTQDDLTIQHGLKYARVFCDLDEALASGLKIDTDDSLAMTGTDSFALLDNFKYSKKQKQW